MEGSVSRQFGIYLVFWVAYFVLVYSGCLWAYFRLLGRPPEGGGKPALEAWEEKERGLRRRFYRIGAALMLIPLLWPFIRRLFG